MSEQYLLRSLSVAPGGRLSPQRHHVRSGHWVVVKGMARVTRGPHEFTLHPNESVFIPAGTNHRLENHSADEPLEVLELRVGSDLGEDEIERLEGPGPRA